MDQPFDMFEELIEEFVIHTDECAERAAPVADEVFELMCVHEGSQCTRGEGTVKHECLNCLAPGTGAKGPIK